MKILVCGLGKCGSRMVLDLNCLVHGGKNSYELRVQKSPLEEKNTVKNVIGWFRNFFSSNRSRITYIPEDDLPTLHLGDSDPDNEITGGYLVSRAEESEDDKKRIDKHLKALIDNKIVFSNFDDACGQYHSIGEMVMDDLLKQNEFTRQRIVQNPVRDCRCYICCFSTGGGTGCGVSSRLISHVTEEAESKYKTMFTAGLAILPEKLEDSQEINYCISAGRFLTKFFASKYEERQGTPGMIPTNFDAAITMSNSIITKVAQDKAEAEAKVNSFAAHLMCSIINSSSRSLRSTRNPDAPELKKNLSHLAFFCYAEVEPGALNDRDRIVALFKKAVSPIEYNLSKENARHSNTFEGISIDVTHPRYYPISAYTDLIARFEGLKETAKSEDLKDSLREIIREPSQELPLPMRSARKIMVLYGIPEDAKSTSLDQSNLKELIKAFFPNADIDFYQTYHLKPYESLTMIPSGYLSYEILDLLQTYLVHVWKTGEERTSEMDAFFKELLSGKEFTQEEITELMGEKEDFGIKFETYHGDERRVQSRFGMTDEEVLKYHLTAEDVYKATEYIRDIINFIKKPKVVRPKIEFIRL